MTRGRDEPWLAARALPPALARSWAEAWPRWFGPDSRRLPRAPRKDQLTLLETELGSVVAKRYPLHGWKRRLVRLGARPSRAERAYRNAEALLARGFATPEPLAVLGRPEEAVLVTRFVAGQGLFESWPEESGPERPIEQGIESLAHGIARLHAAGFRHRDLKASNLLLGPSDDGHELVWTDLDGLRRLGTVDARRRARDLARLATSFESLAARAAGVRAGHWPTLVRAYLECALGREPREEELAELLGWTKRWRERWVRRHLARGEGVT